MYVWQFLINTGNGIGKANRRFIDGKLLNFPTEQRLIKFNYILQLSESIFWLRMRNANVDSFWLQNPMNFGEHLSDLFIGVLTALH